MKKSKKSAKAENEPEVLERVMSSIEMAGASLNFFESTPEKQPEPQQAAPKAAVKAAPKAGKNDDDFDEIEEEDFTNEDFDDELDDDFESDEDEDLDDEEADDEAEFDGEDDEDSDDLEAEDFDDIEEFEEVEDDEEFELSEAGEQTQLLQDDANVEFVERNQAISIVESLLFSSDRPLGLGTFKQVFHGTNLKIKDIKKILEHMQSVYADQTRGVTLEEINGGWQLRTKVDNMDFLRKLAKVRPFKLSGPALEVLSIIAYKQPLVKSEVDEIRGVESGHLIRALMEKHLVSFQGKSELPGKPMQYGTTRKFLEIFGLRNLRELPSLDEIDQLLPEGIGVEEEDEKLSDVTTKMAEEYAGNYSEGEDELLKIESTLEGIDTSSEFFEDEKRRQKEKRDKDRATDIREALDVGEHVEESDINWLARYDLKMSQPPEEVVAAEAPAGAVAASDEDNESAEFDAEESKDDFSAEFNKELA